jgi:iron-sulfur cluster assembly protein
MFTLTPAAAEQIRRAAEAQDDKPVLRVAAKVDDDGGMSYGMGFDEERENDQRIESEGVTILISERSWPLLAETTLDFVELHAGEFQFVFLNPREQELCAGQQTGGCSSCGSRGQCG